MGADIPPEKEAPPPGCPGGWLASPASPLCSLHYVTRQSLSVSEGIMIPGPAWAAFSIWCCSVCVFLSMYSRIALTLCHFSAVCVSMCGPCITRLSVLQHLAAGVQVCRETIQNHVSLLIWGRIGLPCPLASLTFHEPWFFPAPSLGCLLCKWRQRQLAAPAYS